MDITLDQAAAMILDAQDILLLAHKSPDGDTLGSCSALCCALRALGKRARVECSDPIPEKYAYFLPEEGEAFEPGMIAALDVADVQLFGQRLLPLASKVDLCIDHHATNTRYAAHTYVDPSQAATAQIIFRLLERMGCEVTPVMADAMFTGVSTDTGCFRYSNVTPETMRIGAQLMEYGARAAMINERMFETNSRARVQAERRILDTLIESFDGRCAEIVISNETIAQTGVRDDELEGISAIPRRIEGVWVSVTYRERENGYKISMRSNEMVDSSVVCAALGGGGHQRAAGCFIEGNLSAARRQVRAVLESWMTDGGKH